MYSPVEVLVEHRPEMVKSSEFDPIWVKQNHCVVLPHHELVQKVLTCIMQYKLDLCMDDVVRFSYERCCN